MNGLNEERRMQTGEQYKKDLTVDIEMVGEEKISAMEMMRKIKETCGELLACRSTGERRYEVTMKTPSGKEKVMDGFKIRGVNVMGKELVNNELMVSFMGLPAYTTEEEIKAKLNVWGVSAVSPFKRRMWPGTDIADGTRYGKVKFNSAVQSLPYSTKFDTATGPEYFRVIHDRQARVCRMCIQPGHMLRDCPEFTCFKCHKQGHYARECVSEGGRRREEGGDEKRQAEGEREGEAEDGEVVRADEDDGEAARVAAMGGTAPELRGERDGGGGEQEDEAESSCGEEMEEAVEQTGELEMEFEEAPEKEIESSPESEKEEDIGAVKESAAGDGRVQEGKRGRDLESSPNSDGTDNEEDVLKKKIADLRKRTPGGRKEMKEVKQQKKK